MGKKLSGYDVSETVTLHLPGYLERQALVEFYPGSAESWTPERGFDSLCQAARQSRTMKPVWDRHINASALADWLARNMSQSLYIGAEWAAGNRTAFNEWSEQFVADYDKAEWLVKIHDAENDGMEIDCGGGSYGMRVYIVSDIVVMMDTEHNAWVFPVGTDYGPDVENFEMC